MLHEGVRREEEVLLDLLGGANEFGRCDEVAEAPPRHRVRLGEAVEDERTVGVGQDRAVGTAEIETVVDLIAGDVDAGLVGDPCELAQIVVGHDGPRGITRRIDHDRLGSRTDGGADFVEPVAKSVGRTRRHERGGATEERDVVGVRRVARVGHDDFVARIEKGAEEQQHRR